MKDMEQQLFENWKALCIKHSRQHVDNLRGCKNFDELAKHLYGIYRVVASAAKYTYEFAEDKEDVLKSCRDLEQGIQLMEQNSQE